MKEVILREPRKLALSVFIVAGMVFGCWLGLRVSKVAAPVSTPHGRLGGAPPGRHVT